MIPPCNCRCRTAKALAYVGAFSAAWYRGNLLNPMKRSMLGQSGFTRCWFVVRA